MQPQVLPPNVLRHFYTGGARIAAQRGLELDSDHMPEEWLGAVNATFGSAERGLSRLEDGTLVRDAVAAEPAAWLGRDHVRRHGSDPGLLVKRLDAGQRLPVHFHPGRRFAREAFCLDHGKTDGSLLPPGADPYFRAERLIGGASLDPGFSVRVGPAGEGRLAMEGCALPFSRGSAMLVPFASGAGVLEGDVEALRAQPADPAAREGRW